MPRRDRQERSEHGRRFATPLRNGAYADAHDETRLQHGQPVAHQWRAAGATRTARRLHAQEPLLPPLNLERAGLRDADYVGRLLGIPRKTVLRYARDGRLPCVRLGKHVRFVVADVEAAIDIRRRR